MTVAELIELLKKHPADMRVAYRLHSEQCLLMEEEIKLLVGCVAREDGWVQDHRPDMPSETYLLLPGN